MNGSPDHSLLVARWRSWPDAAWKNSDNRSPNPGCAGQCRQEAHDDGREKRIFPAESRTQPDSARTRTRKQGQQAWCGWCEEQESRYIEQVTPGCGYRLSCSMPMPSPDSRDLSDRMKTGASARRHPGPMRAGPPPWVWVLGAAALCMGGGAIVGGFLLGKGMSQGLSQVRPTDSVSASAAMAAASMPALSASGQTEQLTRKPPRQELSAPPPPVMPASDTIPDKPGTSASAPALAASMSGSTAALGAVPQEPPADAETVHSAAELTRPMAPPPPPPVRQAGRQPPAVGRQNGLPPGSASISRPAPVRSVAADAEQMANDPAIPTVRLQPSGARD